MTGEDEAKGQKIPGGFSADELRGNNQNNTGGESEKLNSQSSHVDKGGKPLQEPDAEKSQEKDARKLAKKLRQAKELKDRKEKGDALLPEQLEKVIRINEITRQLEGLGFDTNGEKKNGT